MVFDFHRNYHSNGSARYRSYILVTFWECIAGPPILEFCRKEGFDIPRSTSNQNIQHNEREKTENPRQRTRVLLYPEFWVSIWRSGVLVCRLLVFMNISYEVSELEKTVLQLAPGHQWTRRSPAAIPSGPSSITVWSRSGVLSSTKCMHTEKSEVLRPSLKKWNFRYPL